MRAGDRPAHRDSRMTGIPAAAHGLVVSPPSAQKSSPTPNGENANQIGVSASKSNFARKSGSCRSITARPSQYGRNGSIISSTCSLTALPRLIDTRATIVPPRLYLSFGSGRDPSGLTAPLSCGAFERDVRSFRIENSTPFSSMSHGSDRRVRHHRLAYVLSWLYGAYASTRDRHFSTRLLGRYRRRPPQSNCASCRSCRSTHCGV